MKIRATRIHAQWHNAMSPDPISSFIAGVACETSMSQSRSAISLIASEISVCAHRYYRLYNIYGVRVHMPCVCVCVCAVCSNIYGVCVCQCGGV